jgi:hypothetical protein
MGAFRGLALCCDGSVSLESGAAAADLCRHAGAADVAGCLFLERLADVDVTAAMVPQSLRIRGGLYHAGAEGCAGIRDDGVLALLGYRRQEFFVSSGPHRKLWIGSGVVAALVMGLTMVVYLQTTAAEAKGAAGATRYLPLALVLAAMNSFAEEMLYRGVLFGPLLRQVTANQAISMTAVLFGIAHYHGTPSGFPGMGLTFIAGWVFGLAMVETRSILLPWLLHFVPDAVIYVTSALKN